MVWSDQARQRRASTTPGATMAPVGQAGTHREQVPHPSGTGAVATSLTGASVRTDPRMNQLPAPGISRLAFLPNQPRPARWATPRSTRWFWSDTTQARQPAAFSAAATVSSPATSTSWSSAHT